MPLAITYDQYKTIAESAKKAHESLEGLQRDLSGVMLQHIKDVEVVNFLCEIESRLADAQHVTNSLAIVDRWAGNDRDGNPIFTPYEPNALSMVGRIPHAIKRP